MKPHAAREAWLEDTVKHLETGFSRQVCNSSSKGFLWMSSPSSPRTTLGQCWPRECSGGEVNEIFISPKLDEPVQLLDTLLHELCHAVDDCFSGNGEDCKGITETVGLDGPARMAHATEELAVKLHRRYSW